MAHLNRLLLEGTITRDAELKYTNSGNAILGLSIANNMYAGPNKPEHVSFFNVVMFGKVAEAFSKYMIKGVTILITSAARIEEWTDNQGNKRNGFKAVVGFGDTVRITRKSAEAEQRFNAMKGEAPQKPQQTNSNPGNSTGSPPSPPQEETFQDDIPF